MEKFVLKNENGGYLIFKHGSTPKITDQLSLSTIFDTRELAENRLIQIPKKIGKCKVVSINTIVDSVEQNTNYKDFDVETTYELLNDQVASIKSVVGNQKVLEDALNKIALIEEDIKHFIELNNLNAAQGYNIYKVQHSLYAKRREIKDKLKAIDFIRTSNLSELMNGSAKVMQKRIKNRKYGLRTSEAKDIFTYGMTKSTANKVCEKIRSIV